MIHCVCICNFPRERKGKDTFSSLFFSLFFILLVPSVPYLFVDWLVGYLWLMKFNCRPSPLRPLYLSFFPSFSLFYSSARNYRCRGGGSDAFNCFRSYELGRLSRRSYRNEDVYILSNAADAVYYRYHNHCCLLSIRISRKSPNFAFN